MPANPEPDREPPRPSAADLCRARIAEIAPDEELASSMEGYYRGVPLIILSAKIVPVIYLRRPERSASPRARSIRTELLEARRKERAVRKILKTHAEDRALLREVFLAEGYFFEDVHSLASAVVRTISLVDLFDEEVIYLHRGREVRSLSLEGSEYVDQRGERVSLLLNDRVSTTPDELEGPLHLDADLVREETGAQRVIPGIVGERRVVARLVFPGGLEADSVLEQDGFGTRVSCIAADESDLEAAGKDAEVFWAWNRSVFDAAVAMVEERPGFDEPVDEPEGDQEDGKLRIAWRKGYYRWESKFKFREEEYRVYDRRGNPTPPQVCIDFIFDTWERSSGNWFRKRGERPGRSPGFLDFKEQDGLLKRHTPSVLAYATANPDVLERYDFPRKDHVPFRRRDDFAEAVAANAHMIREGDLLVIHGLREEDMEEHFHTMLVLRTDPISGMPMVVADNAGRPRIRNLASGMRSAPRRSIKHRIRIGWDWLLRGMKEKERGENGAMDPSSII